MTKRAIFYKRVSTTEQGNSKNGLEAQQDACEQFASYNGYEIVDSVEEVASGKLDLDQRAVLRAAVTRCIKEKITLIVSKLDRLSRDAHFVLSMMKTKVVFVVADLGEDVDPTLIHVYAIFAQKEREMISQRTKAGLAQVKARGIKLGNPRKYDQVFSDGSVKLGCISSAKIAGAANASKADEFALRMKPSIERMLAYGMSKTSIAKELNLTNTKTQNGGMWHTTTVCSLIKRWEAI